MSGQLAIQRLMREKAKMEADPSPNIIAIPSPQNLFEWHFILFNFADDSPYKGGQFHGIIQIPAEYPLKPPAILFVTPQGRFRLQEKICLSFTNYHPETWTTSWTIASMLIGLISFMHTDERGVGAIESHPSQKKQLAERSISFNLQNPKFVELFTPYYARLGIKAPEVCISVEKENEEQLLPTIQNRPNKLVIGILAGIIIAVGIIAIILI